MRLFQDRDVRVTYVAPGERPEDDVASDVQVGSDSVQWSRWESQKAREDRSPAPVPVWAPIDAVRKISVCEPGCQRRGILQGVTAGAIAGVLASAIAFTTCAVRESGRHCGLYWIPGPVLGVALGAAFGSSGARTVIEFQPAPR